MDYNINELGKTAIEKFGTDPKPFLDTLKRFKTINLKKLVRKLTRDCPSSYFKIVVNGVLDTICVEYSECLISILQVDLEYPGFIKQFPEAQKYLVDINGNKTRNFVHRFNKICEKAICHYNRYSGKSDLNYVKKLFKIEEKDIRFDDYISKNFLTYWKMNNKEIHSYLVTNYIHQEVLLPPDYKEIIKKCKIEIHDDLGENDLKWIDIYFENQDNILEIVRKNIGDMSPGIMKKINLTLT